MKLFKSVIMVKHPRDLVWETIRDHLSEIVPYLDDIASVTTEQRAQDPDGVLQLVNLWQADIAIPDILTSVIDTDSVSWTDHAGWHPNNHECHWQIKPHFFSDRISCSGSTHYESAIGGRGTRITFAGQFDVSAHDIPGIPAFMENSAAKVIESLVTTLIPKNFRKITDALPMILN
ncbi:MAG: hypothetical protein JMN24_16095 [gamma proteobacterium endosymbiont of Lamellibrachia anaximandri]|nr:hypothetical protein [gamma proteobacterium endosymbiont of Lamellibrachia anaximandri]MBL3619361.1 hypothetical protein [gamma proteobacterium endosymbiont of Lamellibrachia anaximandri]